MSKRLNLVGQRFGRLLVIKDAGNNNQGKSLWKCKCDCGNRVIILGSCLTSKHSQSCGCYRRDRTIQYSRIDLTDKKFGRLTVLKYSHTNNKRAYWLCQCDCGNEVIIASNHLRDGGTKSCGCLHLEIVAKTGKNNIIHGLTYTKEYKNAQNAKHKAMKMRQTPKLTIQEEKQIEEIYHKCSFMSKLDDIEYHIDHIKPLSKGGLHHPDNLQILTAKDNLRKSDKLIL